ncbi:MAG: hypothetical protein QOH82_313 [Mycobacterium sp.]|nr:hypothetical protein [Mycobacterium sp.]
MMTACTLRLAHPTWRRRRFPSSPTVSRCFGFDGHLNGPAGDLARNPSCDLSKSGLGPALKTLARRFPVAVSLDLDIDIDRHLTRSKSARTTSWPRR